MIVKIAVTIIAKGRANKAVGKTPNEMPKDWNHHVKSIVIIVPKAIRSPCAKLAKRKIPKINVTPRAPRANCEPYEIAGTITKFANKASALIILTKFSI